MRGKISLAATPAVPGTKESWMGILNAIPGGAGFALRVFSSTGFMTRYQVTLDSAQVHLNPEGGDQPPPGWLFRRLWVRTEPNEFTDPVPAAPPGKPFFDYYTAKFTERLRRKNRILVNRQRMPCRQENAIFRLIDGQAPGVLACLDGFRMSRRRKLHV